MDKKTADKLIAVLDEEIATLQRDKREILRMVQNGGGGSTQASGALPNVSEPVKQVYQALLEWGGKTSPKDLHRLLQQKGIQIEAPRMRQILHQYKDRLFESRKRGVWSAINLEE